MYSIYYVRNIARIVIINLYINTILIFMGMPILNTKLQIEKLVYKILVEVYLLSNLSLR